MGIGPTTGGGDDSPKPYWESQRGGLCRMHALNMYLGGPVYNEQTFAVAINEYDAYMRDRFGVETSAAAFDLVGSDQMNLVSWLLRKRRIVVRYIAIGHSLTTNDTTAAEEAPGIFIYNQGHIWCARRVGGVWWLLDSLSRPQQIGAAPPLGWDRGGQGYMIVVDAHKEWTRNCELVERALESEGFNARDANDVGRWAARLNAAKRILGSAEVPLGCAVGILETFSTADAAARARYAPIVSLVARYNEFIRMFVRGRYGDLRLVLQYVPGIVVELMGLMDGDSTRPPRRI